jgi:8-oxo-dGTP pyrophosphatase MutT (NUDIX family)
MSPADSQNVSLLVPAASLPDWYRPLMDAISKPGISEIVRFQAPADVTVRHSAVLILLADGADLGSAGPDILLIERAADMRSHAGQPAFPGGAEDPEDDGPIATALREALEETGLDPAGVVPVATLPQMWLPPSGFVVTPVLGWWKSPSPVRAADPAEVAAVHRVPLADFVKPENRVQVSHPSGFTGPGFLVSGMLVWGFTAMLLDRLFALAGWEQPWQADARTVPFDDGWRPPGQLSADR